MRKWHMADADNRMYCNLTDGKKISMPRYYKLKLYTDEERESIGAATLAKMESRRKKEQFIKGSKLHQARVLADRNSLQARSVKGDRF